LDAMHQEEDAPPQSSLEEAIEYCSSNDNQQTKRWISMGGNVALRDILLQTIQEKHSSLTRTDVDWNARLIKLEQFCKEQEEQANAAVAANEQQEEKGRRKTDSTSSEAATETDEQREESDSSPSSSNQDDGDDDENNSTSSSSSESLPPPKVDLAMFVGMFRTAMEMVQEEDPRFAMVV
jgi:hypothetical protein